MSRYSVAPLAEVPPGRRLLFEAGRRSIGVFNIDGRLFALRNRCPHLGGPLCEGPLLGHLEAPQVGEYDFDPGRMLISCPWHGWEYDLDTGQSWFDPLHNRTGTYDVSIEPGVKLDTPIKTGLAKGPYVAETVEVFIEEDWIVVEVPD